MAFHFLEVRVLPLAGNKLSSVAHGQILAPSSMGDPDGHLQSKPQLNLLCYSVCK